MALDFTHKTNPFTVLTSKPIYSNAWIDVVEHQVLTPRKTPGIYGTVSFKHRAVGVIPYADGYIWLVGQYRFPLKQYSWEIPEGGSPQGEDLVETARRELKEETGLEAKTFELITRMHLSNSVSDEYGEIFLARDITVGTPNPEDTEELSLQRISLEEAYRLVVDGTITDSLSVAGIFRLMLMKYEGTLG